MKIAIITSGDPNNMKGVMNYVQEKLKLIQRNNELDVDFYMLRYRDTLLFSLIRREKRPKKINSFSIGEVNYNSIWIRHSFFDYILTVKFKIKALMDKKYLKREIDRFSNYSLIVSHGPDSHYISNKLKDKYSIPYITTWHGSDINIMPFSNNKTFFLIKKMIEEASMNYFVSKKLLNKSNEITEHGIKDYIYTGPSSDFYTYNNGKIEELKDKYNCKYKRVIGFVGNIIPIKNVLVLPKIFEKVRAVYTSNELIFWIIGDGSLEGNLKNELDKIGIKYRMFGKVEPKEIPNLMNCLDVLVLPSLNEGMPLVTLEALACGINVVGSNVGGIPESIGKENCFDLNDNFIDNISNRIIEILENNEKPKPLSPEFSWEYAIEKEVNTYKRILNL